MFDTQVDDRVIMARLNAMPGKLRAMRRRIERIP
jgi:hypothetical protein